jgi:hypothetical protein
MNQLEKLAWAAYLRALAIRYRLSGSQTDRLIALYLD